MIFQNLFMGILLEILLLLLLKSISYFKTNIPITCTVPAAARSVALQMTAVTPFPAKYLRTSPPN